MLALDYDDFDYDDVFEDAVACIFQRHFRNEGAKARIYNTSPRHYHVVIEPGRPREFMELIRIARDSCSSQDYIDRAVKVGYFMLRTTEKSDGTPAPVLVFEKGDDE